MLVSSMPIIPTDIGGIGIEPLLIFLREFAAIMDIQHSDRRNRELDNLPPRSQRPRASRGAFGRTCVTPSY